MIAYQQPRERQNDRPIMVTPTAPRHAEQMVDVMCAAYGCTPAETYSADQFRQHVRIFPEGQYVALAGLTDRVVGLTASMRVSFEPSAPLLESWVETTNYG